MIHATLILTCKDQKGIVAKLSNFLYKNNANIVAADQFSTDPEGGTFFIRMAFGLPLLKNNDLLEKKFEPLGKDLKARWKFFYNDTKLRMGILVSKPDHCLEDILYLWRSGDLNVDIPFIISNHPDHELLVRRNNLPFFHIPANKKDRRETDILKAIKTNTDFLILARYMQILSGDFIKSYGKDIINVHHSFLPSFKGTKPYTQAFDHGVKVIGATAHFVSEKLDEGPIITQKVQEVSHKNTIDSLKRKGKSLEKLALAEAIHLYLDHRIMRNEGKTVIFS